ncbi:unnamed protein product [Clonostachys chloroleuca]|uniref:Uncharacterized protein n=1 Tax=Clonostachys chloroleuca TaxID=1926264 RepID=A0AA35MJB4_9HYPO|nr:unnamed protein product [Clonostachys chloroleuca]
MTLLIAEKGKSRVWTFPVGGVSVTTNLAVVEAESDGPQCIEALLVFCRAQRRSRNPLSVRRVGYIPSVLEEVLSKASKYRE